MHLNQDTKAHMLTAEQCARRHGVSDKARPVPTHTQLHAKLVCSCADDRPTC